MCQTAWNFSEIFSFYHCVVQISKHDNFNLALDDLESYIKSTVNLKFILWEQSAGYPNTSSTNNCGADNLRKTSSVCQFFEFESDFWTEIKMISRPGFRDA